MLPILLTALLGMVSAPAAPATVGSSAGGPSVAQSPARAPAGAPIDWSRAAAQAEREGRYADALVFHKRILEEASTSYLARNAGLRAAELQAHNDHDFVPYGRFQRLLSQYAAAGTARSVAEARSIMEDFPDARIVPEVLYWLGNEFRETHGDVDQAAAYYRDLANRFPTHPLTFITMDRLGRMLQAANRPHEAAEVYREMALRLPGKNTPQSFETRLAELTRAQRRLQGAALAQAILLGGGVFFFLVGGHRLRAGWLRASLPRVGFALMLGIAPAAFLWLYDDQWSPSLTALSLSFAAYSLILGALAARRKAPGGKWMRIGERAVFGMAAPLAIVYLIVHSFALWEAFLL